MKLNITINTLFLVLAFSCASTDEVVKEVSHIKRVKIEQANYIKPQVFIGDYKFSKKKNFRKIASENYLPKMSNREAYFLSFYKQHLNLATSLGIKPELNNCPSFHNLILEHKTSLFRKDKNYSIDINLENIANDYSKVSDHPVLSVPYSDTEDLLTRLHQTDFKNSKKDLKQALSHFYQTEKKELGELCETGVSPSYYIYENLISYFKNTPSFHRTQEGLLAILKIPVVSKMIILDNLVTSETHMNANLFDHWLVEKAGLSWIEEFRHDLKKKRTKQIGFNQKAH